MSIASSFPCIKIKTSPAPYAKPCLTVRSSKAEGPLRRPSAPSLSPPPSLTTTRPTKPAVPSVDSPLPPPAAGEAKGVVTLEYQRRIAKELQDYFRQKKLEEADQGPFFGFTGKNEITNGRWAMFGFAVGLLTEYATASDFVQQIKILASNFGIVDLD
ncbi:hypothetical protein AXF42_Ash011298 [Apostasia shenzhenica]|uniref:Light-harvesting complex-like protein OHP2, chloroplastic n=1 Tax=Apostasia shenzhenica TaxID=1088818 RepID=A0A2I0AE41_9ASPA|nr:hypothetical protein AXF42_Ash011298 [Apostasia shenzhenica]